MVEQLYVAQLVPVQLRVFTLFLTSLLSIFVYLIFSAQKKVQVTEQNIMISYIFLLIKSQGSLIG